MGRWSWLFGPRGPEPVCRVGDPVFGPLVWSDDEESWVGEYGGYPIAIGYSGFAEPAPELLAYAREFLGADGATFTRNLAAVREADAHEFVEGGQKVGHFDGQLRTSKTVAGRGVRGTDARRIAGPVPLLAQRRRTMPAGKTGS